MATPNLPAERRPRLRRAPWRQLRYRVRRLLSAALLGLAAAAPSAYPACHGMVLHAHRGAPAAPENSFSAVRQALQGDWDGAEIDIQQLRDLHWVLHHDPRLGRTTSLRGRSTRELDRTAWREVRLKDRQGRLVNEPAPFLDELLAQLPESGDKVLNVEIKQLAGASCDGAQQALAALQRGWPGGNWFVTAIDRQQLRCVRRADAQAYVGQVVLDPRALARRAGTRVAGRLAPTVIDAAWLRRLQQEVGAPVGVHVDIHTLDSSPTLLADAQALGMPVFTYHLGPDRDHAQALRAQALRAGLLPSGAIIDGAPGPFCTWLAQP